MKDSTIKLMESITAVLGEWTLEYQRIFERLPQYSRSALARVLIVMVDSGKIITSGSKVHKKYTLAENYTRAPIAPAREFKPLTGRDPFANWRLCQRDPFDEAGVPRLIR